MKSSEVYGRMSALSKYTLNRDYMDMFKFDKIAELAIDNYGIVTTAEVVKLVN